MEELSTKLEKDPPRQQEEKLITTKRKKTSQRSSKEKNSLTPTKLESHFLAKTIKLDNLYYSFHQKELEEILQSLNNVLNTAAIKLTANEFTELKVEINMDKFQSITKRRAGRKKKKTNVLYEEILEYTKTHTAMETAEWLGLTRQTYYRKLKEHRLANHDGSVEF